MPEENISVFSKIRSSLGNFRSFKNFKLIATLLILLGLPLTVFLSLQLNDIRQRASEVATPPTPPKPTSATLSYVLGDSENSNKEVRVGEQQWIGIELDPGVHSVSVVKLDMQFDPSKFKYVSVDTGFGLMRVIEGPLVDQDGGRVRIALAVSDQSSQGIRSKVQIASLGLMPISPTDTPTYILFGATQTQVLAISNDQSSENVLGNMSPLIVSVLEGSLTPQPTVVYPTAPTTPAPTVYYPTGAITPTPTPNNRKISTRLICDPMTSMVTPPGRMFRARLITSSGQGLVNKIVNWKSTTPTLFANNTSPITSGATGYAQEYFNLSHDLNKSGSASINVYYLGDPTYDGSQCVINFSYRSFMPTPAPTKIPTPTVALREADLVVKSFQLTDARGAVKAKFKVNEEIFVQTILANDGEKAGKSVSSSTYTLFFPQQPSVFPPINSPITGIHLKNGEFGPGYIKSYASNPVSPTNGYFRNGKSFKVSRKGSYSAIININYNRNVLESNYDNNQRSLRYIIE